MRFVVPVVLVPLLAACTSLPSQGPTASDVMARANDAAPPFDVVALSASTADAVSVEDKKSLGSTFGMGGGAPDLRIGVGDVVSITIYEAAMGGLFTGEAGALGSASKSVSIPAQPVARNGTISVPYVGQVRAAGFTPAQVQAQIEAGLANKAIEPQVIVTVPQTTSTFVTVTGNVGQSGRTPLNMGGDRVLDVIAAAGGTRNAPHDTEVQLTRGGRVAKVRLARILADPSQNIYLRPGDQIFVINNPRTYTVLGAAGRNASVPLEVERLTLIEAVGRAGGLLDDRANARGVFVFRYEDPSVYARLRNGAAPPTVHSAGVPVVYQLDLSDPSGYFAAQRFLVRDDDVLYVANASSVELRKFLALIGTGVGLSRSSVTLGSSVENAVN